MMNYVENQGSERRDGLNPRDASQPDPPPCPPRTTRCCGSFSTRPDCRWTPAWIRWRQCCRQPLTLGSKAASRTTTVDSVMLAGHARSVDSPASDSSLGPCASTGVRLRLCAGRGRSWLVRPGREDVVEQRCRRRAVGLDVEAVRVREHVRRPVVPVPAQLANEDVDGRDVAAARVGTAPRVQAAARRARKTTSVARREPAAVERGEPASTAACNKRL